MKPIVRFYNVSYDYHLPNGQLLPALRGVTFTLMPGEFVALMGANGSGKSTLARLINALLQPSSGTVCVRSWDTQHRAHWQDIRRTVALVFQDPQAQIVGSTVEEDVAFGPRNLGLSSSEVHRRVEWALKTVGMWEFRHRLPFQLSAGQAQRVAIAGALAMQPDVLVLDEATAMLDPAGRHVLLEILRRLNANGMTILLITHFPDEAALAHRLIVLHQGTIVADGPPQEVFTRYERLRTWGLVPPVAMALAHHLHHILPCVPPHVIHVEDLARYLTTCFRRYRLSINRFVSAPQKNTHGEENRAVFLETRDLWHVYMAGTPLETLALRGVDFKAVRGETVGLMGTTGSGKSTLMQHFNGLLFPHRGKVWVSGRAIEQWRDRLPALRRTVAMLFQRPEDQLFARYVGDDVAAGLRTLHLSSQVLRERVRSAMKAVGLDFEMYKDRPIYALSGGERRKVALAGVLVLQPQALILDEPTAGLDPVSRRELFNYLLQWRQEREITLIYSSHVPEEVARMTERLALMKEGKVVAFGATRDILSGGENLLSLGLEPPVVVQLTMILRNAGVDFVETPLTVEEFLEMIRFSIRREKP